MKNNTYNKIDIHSHIFPAFDGPDSDFELYKEKAKDIKVESSCLAPGPCPKFIKGNQTFYPCLWELEDGNISYKKVTSSEKGEISERADPNPYKSSNENLFKTIRVANKLDGFTKFYATPLHHPILDTEDEIERLCQQEETKGIKVHGIASYTSPADIEDKTIEMLKKFDLPLIVHTDYFDNPQNTIQRAYQKNNPEGWVDFAIRSGVKLVALHGACLSYRAIEKAKKQSNIRIGISPDLLMMTEPERLEKETDNFALDLFRMADPSQLLFDIDYSWNVNGRGDWENQDWNMEERYVRAAKEAGYSDSDIESIFKNNAKEFMKL